MKKKEIGYFFSYKYTDFSVSLFLPKENKKLKKKKKMS